MDSSDLSFCALPRKRVWNKGNTHSGFQSMADRASGIFSLVKLSISDCTVLTKVVI